MNSKIPPEKLSSILFKSRWKKEIKERRKQLIEDCEQYDEVIITCGDHIVFSHKKNKCDINGIKRDQN